uniref:SCHIP-1 domain-containing protein n=1 Tax=Caenorhabditis tropicalis TaxID=1561998 RepID=A0A1I7TX71_9PELO
MRTDNSGVVIGEDALSTYYSTSTSSNTSSASVPLTTSTTSSSASSSSSVSGDRHEAGFLNFFRRRSWFGFGPASEDTKKKQDSDTVTEIMKCFRNNDIDGMEKFVEDEIKNDTYDGSSKENMKENDSKIWWDDDEFMNRLCYSTKVLHRKYTPHPRKGVSKLAPNVLKAVRFDMENTPEDREKRPFTPLFTSTPKNAGFSSENGSDSESEPPPLRECDSNTVVPPHRALNNTSSILLSSTSVMFSLNKCRQQTIDAVFLPSDKNSYKICYDDTDEEEVLEEEPAVEESIPTHPTFVISKEYSVSEQSSKTINLQEQSSDQLDMSTNSSVVEGLDCIDSYIHHLEDEIEAANRYAREKDLKRAIIAIRKARLLQERFGRMNENINEMCSKLPLELEQSNDIENVSAAFNDSQWGLQLGLEADNFEINQL